MVANPSVLMASQPIQRPSRSMRRPCWVQDHKTATPIEDVSEGGGGGQDLLEEEAGHAGGLNVMHSASVEQPTRTGHLLRTTVRDAACRGDRLDPNAGVPLHSDREQGEQEAEARARPEARLPR